jgi:hypothetical protein
MYNPNIPLAYYNRAVAYYKNKNYDKSWEDIYKAQAMGFKPDPRFMESLQKESERQK